MQQDVIIPCLKRSLCLFLVLRCWVLRWTPSTLCNSQITQVGWDHWEATVLISIVAFYHQGRPWRPFPPHGNMQKPRQNSRDRQNSAAMIVFPEVTVAPWIIYNNERWWNMQNDDLTVLWEINCSMLLNFDWLTFVICDSVQLDSGIFCHSGTVSCDCWPPNRKDKLHVKRAAGRTQ